MPCGHKLKGRRNCLLVRRKSQKGGERTWLSRLARLPTEVKITEVFSFFSPLLARFSCFCLKRHKIWIIELRPPYHTLWLSEKHERNTWSVAQMCGEENFSYSVALLLLQRVKSWNSPQTRRRIRAGKFPPHAWNHLLMRVFFSLSFFFIFFCAKKKR